MAYYMNPRMLREQFTRIRMLPPEVKNELEVIIVDDGSPDGEAQGEWIGVPLRMFRIDKDIRWNQDAARNIAVHHADTPWVLLTDMDHIVSVAAWMRIITKKVTRTKVYRFSRMTWEPTGFLTPYKPHPNSWLMTRDMYYLIGGYDERFAGHYGTDAEFRDRVTATAEVIVLDEHIIRVPRETIPDASTTTYVRKGDPIDAGAIPRIKAQRELTVGWRPLRLSNPYRQIYECKP